MKVAVEEEQMMDELLKQFWSKVDKNGECWMWTGAINERGYGTFRGGKNKKLAHKFSFEMFVGPVPEGLQIDHLCHVASQCFLGTKCPHRRCVRPSHLEAVTPKINAERSNSGRVNRERQTSLTHCKKGHEFTQENTGFSSNQRVCRQCARDKSRRYYEKVRAATQP